MRADYLAEVLVDSPRALWEMQEASGNPQDSSGNGLHMDGISAGADYRELGPMDDFAIRVIGGETITRSAHISTLTNNFTIEMLVDVQACTVNDQILFYNGNSGANGWGVVVDANGTVQALCGGVAFLTAGAFVIEAVGGHVHLVIQRDANVWKYWVNGRLHTANAGTTTPNTPSGTVTLGGASIQTAYSYVAVYESVLSEARIKAHYIATSRAFIRDQETNDATIGGPQTTFTCDIPADVGLDDLLIAWMISNDAAAQTITPPDSTWLRIPRCGGHGGISFLDGNGLGGRAWGYYKRASGTESGTVTFTNSTSEIFAMTIFSVANVNIEFPFGYIRGGADQGDVAIQALFSPFRNALGIHLDGYHTTVNTDESSNAIFTGGAAGNWIKQIIENIAVDEGGGDVNSTGLIVSENSINAVNRAMGGSPDGATTLDLAVAGTGNMAHTIVLNSVSEEPTALEFLWAAQVASNTATTSPAMNSTAGTVEGVPNRNRVQLPGMYLWGFTYIDDGETVTLTDWETGGSAREFVNVAASPFNNSEAADRIRLYVGYLSALTEADCWHDPATEPDNIVGTFSAARGYGMGVLAYIGPNIDSVIFPDGTFEETTDGSTAPDQTPKTITADGSIAITVDASEATTAVTVPSGYTERFETPNSFPKLTAADKAGVAAGTEDPGAWTTGLGRHVLWFNAQSSEPDRIFPQIVFIQS